MASNLYSTIYRALDSLLHMKTFHYIIPVVGTLIAVQCSCSQNAEEQAVAEYVTAYDTARALKQLQVHKHRAQLTKQAWVRDDAVMNIIYGPNGSVIYSGGPAANTETVWINSPSGPSQVSTMASPQGCYVTFTPAAVYVTDGSTGQKSYVPRRASAAGAKPASASASAGSAAPSAASPR